MPIKKNEKANWLVSWALRRPLTVLALVLAVAASSFMGLRQMSKDILPNLDIPVIYVAQPYGGMDASQMESFLTFYYEYHFLYIGGIEHVESKNIQSMALIKLQFHPGTNMSQALAETVQYVNRAHSFMPPGILPPFVLRFDVGSVPVGDLVFSSDKRTLGELQDFALNYVRPLFSTLPGVSSLEPFGASQRTIIVNVDPAKLREYNLSPQDVTWAVNQANQVIPSGNINNGTLYPIVSLNSVVSDIHQLDNLPIRIGTYPTVLLKDVATVSDSTDLQTGYALVNGKRTVYLPVTKRADASTLSVVKAVRDNLARFQNVVPEDVKISFDFDQSGYVKRAIGSLVTEGLLGAFLTGLMVFLFLRDARSALIVVLNIPLAILGAVLALWVTKQTVNIMTLGGLALAIGILVDETTVTIENIHAHWERGKSLARAALDASSEIVVPLLLNLLCVLAVFIPSFFMKGVAHALFVPLTLAVGFSMIGSFLLSRTLVPVLAVWLLGGSGSKDRREHSMAFHALKENYTGTLNGLFHARKPILLGYFLAAGAAIYWLLGFGVGREIFPRADKGQLQIRFRDPAGTWIDQTESTVLKALDIIKEEAGAQNIISSVGYVGTMPPTYPINMVYLWTSGPQEAVLQVNLDRYHGKVEQLKERLRKKFTEKLPGTSVSFEPSSLLDRIMSLGSTSPIEVSVSGKSLADVRAYAAKIKTALADLPFLRDLQYPQVFDYPTIKVTADRLKAGIEGMTMAGIGNDLVPATSSSRYIAPCFWEDPSNGINYQVQVQVPPGTIKSVVDIQNLPVSLNGGEVTLGGLATVQEGTSTGEFDRYNMQRVASLTANLSGKDLGRASQKVQDVLKPLVSSKPKGVEVTVRGQTAELNNVFGELSLGLGLAIIVIFLLLTANFESVTLSLIVLSTLPAAILGVGLALFLTGSTLNLESFMGAIMTMGVAVANAILLVTFAEKDRLRQGNAWKAALEGARSRLRPILMTTLAMAAGMLPLALGWGDGGQESAPLGRAVIGGLTGATLATLLLLPLVFAAIQKNRPVRSDSLNPNDPESRYYNERGEK